MKTSLLSLVKSIYIIGHRTSGIAQRSAVLVHVIIASHASVRRGHVWAEEASAPNVIVLIAVVIAMFARLYRYLRCRIRLLPSSLITRRATRIDWPTVCREAD